VIAGIDPGIKGNAICVLRDDGEIEHLAFEPGTGRSPHHWVQLAHRTATRLAAFPVTTLWIEMMKIYKNGHADPDDLLVINGIVGATFGVVSADLLDVRPMTMHGVLPSDWKGQVPSKVITARFVDDVPASAYSGIPRSQLGDVAASWGIARHGWTLRDVER
jgi:hypothetical protein